MKVCSFNIKNDIKKYSRDKEKEIIKYLTDNKIDILNIQELYIPLFKDLKKDLSSISYHINNRFQFF